MKSARILRYGLPLLLFCAVALLSGATFRYPLVLDDPFITYRYSQNLLNGAGFVYNAGARVLSTTTPLYALLLAAAGIGLHDIPALGFWLAVAGIAACAWLVYLLLDRSGHFAGGLAAGLLIPFSPGLVLAFGLETGLYLALAFAAIVLYFGKRIVPAFLALALLTLTRNDGVVLAAVLSLDLALGAAGRLPRSREDAIQIGRVLVRPLAAYLSLLLPWFAFAWIYYGTPLPFTLTAKIAQAQSGLWPAFFPGWLAWLRDWVIGFWPLALLATIGVVVAVRRRMRLLLVAAWALAHVAAYSLLGVAFYAWYAAPFLVALILFAGLGIGRLAGSIASAVRVPRAALLPALAIVLTLLVMEYNADLAAGMQSPSPKLVAYRQAAEWLAQNTPPESTVDALEVGVIGYYDERRTVDFVGLVDPGRVPFTRAVDFAGGVRQAAADYVVKIPPDEWLPVDAWFVSNYQPVHEIRVSGFYSGRPLVIFRRIDSGLTLGADREVNLTFDRSVLLSRVESGPTTVKPGDVFPLLLHLELNGSKAQVANAKITIQLVGTLDRVAAQVDTPLPSRSLADGQPHADHQVLRIPNTALAGEYDLIVAVYDTESGERQSVYDQDHEIGDFIPLGKVEIR